MDPEDNELTPFEGFVWSVGEEGSDPIVTRDGADFRHDQFVQSGHDVHQDEDLGSIRDLGVELVRYGTPWRLAEPQPETYDWQHWDRAFAACDAAGLEPIVEFLHFGLPDHYTGFLDATWVDGFCRYVDAFIARYPGHRFFTPINEPGVTARFSARLGFWNDRRSTTHDHAVALANVVLANLEALTRLRSDRDAWWIGAEGFDMPIALTDQDEERAARRRSVHWLVWDLHFGTPIPPDVARYLDPVSDAVRARIAELTVTDRLVAGLDAYPVSIDPIGDEVPEWTVQDRIDIVMTEIRRWHERYHQPFWIAETSNLSLPVSDQIPWLHAMADGLTQLRSDGLPARGLCWYSRGDQFDWQTALTNPVGAVTEVGLFDIHRQPRPAAQAFRNLATG